MKYLGQLFSWVITVIVIRILSPDDYGLMAMAAICTNFMMMMSEMGLEAAIIQKETIEHKDLSKLFGFFLISHTALFLLLFFSAASIAHIFSEPRIIPLIKTLSFNFLFIAFFLHQRAMITKAMQFKLKSIVDFFAVLISSLVTLMLALKGYGVWSLIISSLVLNIVYLLGYNIIGKAYVWPSFNFHGIRDFINFGGYSLGIRVLYYFYSKADVLIGGRILGKHLLGIYSVALDMAELPLSRTMPIVNQVAFPAYSKIQNDIPLVRQHFLKTVRIASLFSFPIFWGLATISPVFFGFILGEKWSATIVPIQLLCIIMPFRALATLVSPMVAGIGRIHINFAYVLVASIIMPVSFFFGAKNGMLGLCFAWIIGYSFVFFIILALSIKTIQISIREFFTNVQPAIIAGLFLVIGVFSTKSLFTVLHWSVHELFFAGMLCFIGIISYTTSLYFIKKKMLQEFLALIPFSSKLRNHLVRFNLCNQKNV